MSKAVYDLTIHFESEGLTIIGTNLSFGLKEGRGIGFDSLEVMRYPEQVLNEMLRTILEDTNQKEIIQNKIRLSFESEPSKKEQILEVAKEYLQKMNDLFVEEDGTGSDGCNYDLMVSPETIFRYGVEACEYLFSEFISKMEEN